MQKLSIRQEAFCEAYIRHAGNADAAHEEVYGYSDRTRGYTNVQKLLTHPKIRARIEAIRAGIALEHKDLRERLIEQLSEIAFMSVSDFLSHDGRTIDVRSLDDLTRDQARCIESITQIETKSGPTLRVRFWDKLAAIDRLNKMLGHYRDEDLINRRPFVVRVPFVAGSTGEWLEGHADRGRLPSPPKQIEGPDADAER
jgi:hypothetical protein